MRIIVDTSIVVAAMRSRQGASNALLQAVAAERCAMLASVPLFLEYEAVVTRPEHLSAAQVSRADALGFIDHLAGLIKPVRINYLWRPSLDDPADEMVLEAALNGRATVIVTSNLRHFEPAKRHGIAVVFPGEALKRLP